MQINSSLIPDTAYEKLVRLLAALPNVFKIEPLDWVEVGQPEQFAILMGSSDVATATFDGNSFSFDFSAGNRGDYLEKLLKEKYPDKLSWLIVYPWHDQWSYLGAPTADRDCALADGIPSTAMKSGKCMLVSFTASQWPTTSLRYATSFSVSDNGIGEVSIGGDDLGGGEIELKTLESL